jgi:peptide/nickel transport system substrate-binding protein
MKKYPVIVALAVASVCLASAQAVVKGPIVDKILFDAKTEQQFGLKDVAYGRSDLWNYATDGAAFKALPEDLKSALDVYGITGANSLSLLVNPYPNAAPYTVTQGAATLFNPFAIREVRYALNFLIDRKQIVDEIMVGAGVPMYTPVTPGQPNSSRYALIAGKLGFTPSGNQKKALADIDAAMNAAAALPQNKGRLSKNGKWWTFDGAPVSIKFLIRVDDPTLRLPEGRAIADQIEAAGIKVERLEWDRAKCRSLWGQSDPKDYGWNLYTEGWVGGQTYAFWETSISQMYAPWFANMPGMKNAGFWNYKNDELDRLTSDAANGKVKDAADYYAKLLKAAEIGMKESVRVFIAAQTTFLAANKARFNRRMVYGLGDGLDKWSLYSADVKPETDGTKVLRMSGFSARGALFMSSWDPVGPSGFEDAYTGIVLKECSDMELEANPVTGLMMPLRASWSGLSTKIEVAADGTVTGKTPVPADAVLWNANNQKWEAGVAYVDLKGDGTSYGYRAGAVTAFSRGTFTFKLGAWHDGRPVDINDYRYALAFPYDVAVRKSAEDKVYEEEYAGTVNPSLVRTKGVVFNKDGSVTAYGDANYPMDESELAGLLCPSLMVEASNHGAVVPWEILEAIKGIVSEGSASGTVYAYNSNSDYTEVDLLSQKCVADIRRKLKEYADAERLPASLKGFMTPAEAARDYRRAIDFIDRHGHAFISNGGFILDRYDPATNTGVLNANRDPSYPYARGYFASSLATSFARVDAIQVPMYRRGAGLSVGVTVNEVAFPADTARPAARANVKVTLMAAAETSYTARPVKPGSFVAAIPAKDLAALAPGSYTVIVEASLGTEAGSVDTANLIVF